jgi:hypothetical protein
MLDELDHDKLLYKKRCRQMQDEAAMADKQAKQCDYLDSSVHFMELALASKTAMAKSKHDQNKREVESMISGAQRDLADEVWSF